MVCVVGTLDAVIGGVVLCGEGDRSVGRVGGDGHGTGALVDDELL